MKSRMHSRKSHELGAMPGKFVVKEVGGRKTRFIDLFLFFVFIIGIFNVAIVFLWLLLLLLFL